MSKISILILFMTYGLGWAKANEVSAVIHRINGEFYAQATDKKGLLREYKILNTKDFVYDCLRNEGKMVHVVGEFNDSGKRTGVLTLKSIGEQIISPLGKQPKSN